MARLTDKSTATTIDINNDLMHVVDVNDTTSSPEGTSKKIVPAVFLAPYETHIADGGNPHNISASTINLGNVNNTSDINKPISTATANALDLKSNISNVLTLDNIDAFTPTADYQPSTKKYVDDNYLGTNNPDHAGQTAASLNLVASNHTFSPDERTITENFNNTVQDLYTKIFDRRANNGGDDDYTCTPMSSNTRMIFLGDSNIYWAGLNIKNNRGYFHQKMQDWLRSSNYYSMNMGDPSDTMLQLSDRFARDVTNRYVADSENILFIHAAYNDAWDVNATPMLTYWATLQPMVSSAIAQGYKVYIILCPPWNGDVVQSGRIANGIDGYNDKIKLEAATEGYTVIDWAGRASSDYINWDLYDTSYPISTIPAVNVIKIAGIHTDKFIVDNTVKIINSSNTNDGYYDIVSSIVNGGDTDITISGSLIAGADTGDIILSWVKADNLHYTLEGHEELAIMCVDQLIVDKDHANTMPGNLAIGGSLITTSTSTTQIPDASLGTGLHIFNYALGQNQKLTVTGAITVDVSNFPTGKYCVMRIIAVNWGSNVTLKTGWLTSGGVAPSFTASGRDIVVIEKDQDDIYTVYIETSNLIAI